MLESILAKCRCGFFTPAFFLINRSNRNEIPIIFGIHIPELYWKLQKMIEYEHEQGRRINNTSAKWNYLYQGSTQGF
jgi:hypothetical protein